MKLKINNKEFLKGLETLSGIIKDKHLIPVLECVHISVLNDCIEFTGNNTEVACTTTLNHYSEDTVNGCVKFSTIVSMLRSIGDEDILITFEYKIIRVKHSKGSFKLPLFSGDDYIFFNQGMDGIGKCIIDGDRMKTALKYANKFTVNSDLEPTANILISINDDIVVKATNKMILFEENIGSSNNGDNKDLLISPVASIALTNLIDNDDDVVVRYNDNSITLVCNSESGDVKKEIIIIQQQGEFPVVMFDKIMSMINESTSISIDTVQFQKSLKRISNITNKEYNLVKFIINKSFLSINCDDMNINTSGVEELNCVFDREQTIGFNANFLKEVLTVFNENVKMSLTDKGHFCFVSGTKKGFLAPVLLNHGN